MRIAGRVLGAVLVVGAGVLTVAAIVAAPRLLRAARPGAREALRRGLDLYQRVRGAAAELAEDVEDLVAEAQADLASRRASAGEGGDQA